MSTQFSTVRFDAGHDTNGNPRRVFVVFKAGAIVATYDEGYRGAAVIKNRHHRAAYTGLTIVTTATERRELVALGGKL